MIHILIKEQKNTGMQVVCNILEFLRVNSEVKKPHCPKMLKHSKLFFVFQWAINYN